MNPDRDAVREKRMPKNIKLESGFEDDIILTFKMLRTQFRENPDFAIDAFTAGYPVTKEQARGALSGSIPTVIDEKAETVTLILS